MKRILLIGLVFLMALEMPALAEAVPRPKQRPSEAAPIVAPAADPVATPAAVPGSPVADSPLRSVRPPRRKVDHQAAAPVASPDPAPDATAVRATMSGAVLPSGSIRPLRRPDAKIAAQRATPAAPAAAPAPAVLAAPAPDARPKPRGNILKAIFGGGGARKTAEPPPTVRGSVCGDPAIRGENVPRITGNVRGCGIEDPVRVTEVDGVRLSTAATMDCDTARALRNWVGKGLKPAFGRSEVKGLRVAAHYACRSRNNRPGARISEHGRGKAIDISGILLANGKEISILRDYRSGAGAPVRQAHKAACGTFGTTLGPGSDGFHNDHLHFDTARHRGGPYCR